MNMKEIFEYFLTNFSTVEILSLTRQIFFLLKYLLLHQFLFLFQFLFLYFLFQLHCLLNKIMSNKQVLVYGVLESTNNLRSAFVGHIHFKKLMKFRKFIGIFYCCMTRLRNMNLGVFIHVSTQEPF